MEMEHNCDKIHLRYQLTCYKYSNRLSNLAITILRPLFMLDNNNEGETHNKKKLSFLCGTYFLPCRDQYIRSYKSYFDHRRADVTTSYYLDLLLSSQGRGIEKSLQSVQRTTPSDLLHCHGALIGGNACVECLYTGNIPAKETQTFFKRALGSLRSIS